MKTYEELLEENKVLNKENAILKQTLSSKDTNNIIEKELSEAIPDAIFLIDKKGNFLQFIPAKDFETHVPPDVFFGRNIKDFFSEELSNKFFYYFEKLFETNETQIVEYELDGKYFEARFVISRNGNVISVVRDVTINKKSAIYTQKYNDLITKAPFGFAYHKIILDELNNPIDYEFLEINEAFELMTSLKKIDVINHRITEIIPNIKDDKFNWIEFYGETALNGTEKEFEQYSEILKRWYRVKVYSTEKYYFSTLFEDITFQKEEEQKATLIEKKYKSLIENAPDAVTVIGSDLKYKYASPAIKQLGYTIEELLNLDPNEITNPEDLPLLVDTIQSVLQNPSKPITVEYRFRDSKNNWIWLESTFSNMLNDISIEGIVINSRNIHDRKLAQKKLKESDEKFSKIFNSSPDLIILTKLSNGEIIDVNERFINHTKYNKEDIIGKTTLGINLWANPSDRNQYVKLLNENKFVRNQEYDFKIKSGEVRNGLVSANIITINGEFCVLGTIRDITDFNEVYRNLRESESKFSKIFQMSPSAIVISSIETGEIIEANNTFFKFSEYSYQESIGKTTIDLNFWDKKDQREKVIEKLLNNQKIDNMEFEFKSKYGNKYNCLISSDLIELNNQKYILSVINNMTEIYKVQQELHDREEIYSSIVNQANDSIALVDIETSSFFEFNDIAYKSLGYTKEEFKKLTVKDIDAISTEKEVFDSFALFKENKNGVLETKHKSKTGEIKDVRVSTRYLEIKGKPYLSTIWSDITESKRLSKVLEDKNKFLELVINTIPNQLFWKDENLIYQGCNKVFSDVIGLNDPKNIVGMTDFDLNRKNNYSQSYINDDLKVIKEDKAIINIEEKYFNNRGEEGVVLTSKVPIKSSDNIVIGILGICVDITKNKRIEEEIRLLNHNLEEKVKERTILLERANKDLESFAYSVSHDLRAPIRHIDGFTKILQNSIKDNINEESKKYFSKINDASNKMSKMIDDLLKFSRLGRKSLEKNDVNLKYLITKIIDQYKIDIIDRKIEFIVGDLPTIKGDQGLLQIAFENLISNAIKFTSKKDIAIIEINQCKEDNKNCTVYIKDNGVGFDMAYVDKLFGVFQRLHTENEFSGTGIGLANTKQIIQKHGGNILAKGEVDKGATFYLSL